MNEEKKKRVPICPDSTGFTPAFMRRMITYFEDVDEAERMLSEQQQVMSCHLSNY